MISVDTNVFVALWNPLGVDVTAALIEAKRSGGVLISAPVYAELASAPGRQSAWIDRFFRQTGAFIDWEIDEAMWRRAAEAYKIYATARGRSGQSAPRRILADFVIGAHAVERGCPLLTMDDRIFQSSFPELRVIRV